MKKSVCQLSVCGVTTNYCVDEFGVLYTPNGVTEGYDLRPVNAYRKLSNVLSYPLKRMNLEIVFEKQLIKKNKSAADSTFFKQFYNQSLAVELTVDEMIFSPNKSTMRTMFVKEKITTTGIDNNGYLYCMKKGRSCAIVPNYSEGVQYYTLSAVKDNLVFELPFVQKFGKSNVIKVSDLKEYYTTQASRGLPSDKSEQNDSQKMKLLTPLESYPKQPNNKQNTSTWFDKLPEQTSFLIQIGEKQVETFACKQDLTHFLTCYPFEDIIEIAVYCLAGNIMISPPSKTNELVF
ncbi:MAG: hypothetical protein KDH96_00495 [Candidatus Riesia sp.]|nr:hypothetical protein [Candidatus Riesia sp.]